MDSRNVIRNLRNILQSENSNIILKNGHWLIKNKKEILLNLSSRIFDQHLEIIKEIALEVLLEIHPMFDLNPEERFAASIHGKIPKYSTDIRKGISETLAILGTNGNEFKNCSLHKANQIVNSVIFELFSKANWKLWASLNDVIPILAESAPDAFLKAVEKSLKENPSPFDILFDQEGNGITGSNYLTGLYWAIESLSWNEDLLPRSILILAELATHDPGGNWSNRPVNSIVTILLPWFPQTVAKIEKRIISVKGIQKKYPEIARKIVLNLLPNSQQVSGGSRKPKFRDYIPEDWKKEVSTKEYWEQIKIYSSIAVEIAKENHSLLIELVQKLDNLVQPAFDDLLDHLSSENIIGLPEDLRRPLWETLTSFIKKHRRFSDTKWALSTEMIDSLELTAKKISPRKPENLYRQLFSNIDFDFLDKDEDWKSQQDRLQSEREKAILEIYSDDKIKSVLNFIEKVENPYKVGFALSHVCNSEDSQILIPSSLEFVHKIKGDFIKGFVAGYYLKNGNDWLDEIDFSKWVKDLIINFFLMLPFEDCIWERLDVILGKDSKKYWEKIEVNPFPTQSNLSPAIDKLLNHHRPRLAIECIYAHYYPHVQ